MLAFAYILAVLSTIGAVTVYYSIKDYFKEIRRKKQIKRAALYAHKRFSQLEELRRQKEKTRCLLSDTYHYGTEL